MGQKNLLFSETKRITFEIKNRFLIIFGNAKVRSFQITIQNFSDTLLNQCCRKKIQQSTGFLIYSLISRTRCELM